MSDYDAPKEVQECLKSVIQDFKEKEYEAVGTGRHRTVFKAKDGSGVLKVPHRPDGIVANITEYANYRQHQGEAEVKGVSNTRAKCELLFHGTIPIIKMENVVPHYHSPHHQNQGRLPPWCGQIDSVQVGYTDDGRLVAWDYSDGVCYYQPVRLDNF